MPDALLDLTLKLLDYRHCHEVAPDHFGGFQQVVKILLQIFYIIPKIFESVHKIRIYVGRGLLSLAKTKWLRL